MKLPQPFFRLPVRFDAERLAQEVAQFQPQEWQAHPTGYKGNAAIRLISAGGGENDRVDGAMAPTHSLERCPYIRQVLSGFGVVWGRSRLMRLATHSSVPEHSDINYHWFHRVRIHIPIVTSPEVQFHCGSERVHMGAGECWIFDNWRLHRVENPSERDRVHLVADTTGTARFWNLIEHSQSASFDRQAGPTPQFVAWDPQWRGMLMTEQIGTPRVMPPAEIDLLTADLRADLATVGDAGDNHAALIRFDSALVGFCRDWRTAWMQYGDREDGVPLYRRLLSMLRETLAATSSSVIMASNGMNAIEVVQSRILAYAVQDDAPAPEREYAAAPAGRLPGISAKRGDFDRPIFIVAAPRSGSTLLFETLACSETLWTVGDESHEIIEGLPDLRPGAAGVDSNRLTARDLDDERKRVLLDRFAAELRDSRGRRFNSGESIRFLEKTPKNSLRIPFFDALFPDAKYIFLWRQAHENIASIIEAWGDRRWITYPDLERTGPWHLLVPPGWRSIVGHSIPEIAAFQWKTTNETILADLGKIDPQRWISLSYSDFLRDPSMQVRRICQFAGLPFDQSLRDRVSGPLPLSRYTKTPPTPDKWRVHAAAIEGLMPQLNATLQRLSALRS